MKGTLHKTEQGWVVEYAKHSQLPLHPDQTKYMHLTGKKPNGTFIHDGNEVEFEIVKKVPSEHDVTHGTFVVYKNYAKLINFQTAPLPVFQQLPTSVLEQDVVETMARDFYWSRQPKGKFMAESSRPDMVIGYVEGYNKAKEDLFTEEQVRQSMFEAYVECENGNNFFNVRDKIIQSIKQLKKD
jgi:hypothetical protein